MSLDTSPFAAPYLAENAKSSFPTLATPTYISTVDDGSEISAICGFLFQGKGLTSTSDILDIRIKKFGPAVALTTSDPTDTDVLSELTGGNGLVRFVLSSGDGTEVLDTNDSPNYTACSGGGLIPQADGWRKEEVLRGEYLHGFVQQDTHFLTYIVHFPTFYEFFNPSGPHSGNMADYSSELDKTAVLPVAISPHAESIESLTVIDLYAGTGEPDYPALSSTVNDGISSDLATMFAAPTADYQNIAFCKNDPAGVEGLDETYTPCYISPGLAGDEDCPWASNTGTYLPTYLSGAFGGTIRLSEEFNVEIAPSGAEISFNATAGKGLGYGPACGEDDDQNPNAVVRTLNSVAPNDVGSIYIGGDKCLMVGPDDNDLDPIPGSGVVDSYRIFDGYPDHPTSSLATSELMVSGFCAQCCACHNYENVYRALLKVGGNVGNCDTTKEGVLCKALTTAKHYECLFTQYDRVSTCISGGVTVTVVGWGHYGYLVSAQVLIQNHGEYDLTTTSGLTITFDLDFYDSDPPDPLLGQVEYVTKSSYGNVDDTSVATEDFNPAQPLENIGTPGTEIENSAEGSQIKLTGGDILTGADKDGIIIRRGRYMSIGLTAHLKNASKEDLCVGATPRKIQVEVEGLVEDGTPIVNPTDVNMYECQDALYIPAPCTPPIPAVTWINSGHIYLRFTDVLYADAKNTVLAEIELPITYSNVFSDWVGGWDDTSGTDQCGNTYTYSDNVNIDDPSTWPNSGTNELTPFSLDTAYADNKTYSATVANLEYSNDLNPIDTHTCTTLCLNCVYPAFSSRVNLEVHYTPSRDETDYQIYCNETGESMALTAFNVSTTNPADEGPPLVNYDCESSGSGCHP